MIYFPINLKKKTFSYKVFIFCGFCSVYPKGIKISKEPFGFLNPTMSLLNFNYFIFENNHDVCLRDQRCEPLRTETLHHLHLKCML